MPCFELAWDKAFTVVRNLKGWRIEGLIPFNRNALWKKREMMTRSIIGHNANGPATAAPTPASLLAPEKFLAC